MYSGGPPVAKAAADGVDERSSILGRPRKALWRRNAVRATLAAVSALVLTTVISIGLVARSIDEPDGDVFGSGSLVLEGMTCGDCLFKVDAEGVLSRNACTPGNCQAGSSLDLVRRGIKSIAPNTFDQMAGLTSIDMSENSISALGPKVFTGLTNIRTLTVAHSGVETVDATAFEGLALLRLLDLSKNKINTIATGAFANMGTNPELKTVDLSNQQGGVTIEANAFQNLKSVESLDLSNNNIQTLPNNVFNGLVKCEILSISNTKLKGLKMQVFGQGLGELLFLDASHNELTTMQADNFQGLPKLRTLDLSNNQLRTLPASSFKSLVELRFLQLDHNRMKKVTKKAFEGLKKLQELDLSFNTLEELQQPANGGSPFEDLEELQVLYLSNNAIKILATDDFKPLVKLQSLYLARSTGTGTLAPGCFNGLSTIRMLDMSESEWKPPAATGSAGVGDENLFKGAETLAILNLAKTKNTGVFDFRALGSLEVLDLSESEITGAELKTRFNFAGLKELQMLSLPKNNMGNIPVDSFHADLSSLKQLDLSASKVSALNDGSFNKLYNVEVLKLQKNDLSTIVKNAFSHLCKLIELDLSKNKITTLEKEAFKLDKQQYWFGNVQEYFVGLSNLKLLDLSGNKITVVTPKAFSGLSSLEHLKLNDQVEGGGGITKLETTANNEDTYPFYGLHNLEELDLRNNKIEKLGPSSFCITKAWVGQYGNYLHNLKKLWLGNNLIGKSSAGKVDGTAFYGLDNVHTLDLGNNQLTIITNSNFRTYEHKGVMGSGYLVEEGEHRYLESLQTLDLSHNKIATVESHAFQGLNMLFELNLAHNALTSFDGACMRGAWWFDGTQLFKEALKKSYVAYQFVAGLLGSSLAGRLGSPEGWAEDQFKWVPLSLSEVSEKKLEPTQWWAKDAHQAVFGKIDETFGEQVKAGLEQGRDWAAGIDSNAPFIPLVILNLYNNKMARIQKHAFKVATDVSVIQKWQGKGWLSHVENLDLSNNEIATIDEEGFTGLGHLHVLNLAHNKLTAFSGAYFKGRVFTNEQSDAIGSTGGHFIAVDELQSLDLSFNKIQKLTKTMFKVDENGVFEFLRRHAGVAAGELKTFVHDAPGYLGSKILGSWNFITGGFASGNALSIFDNPSNGLTHQYLSTITELKLSDQTPKLELVEPDSLKGLIQLNMLDLSNNALATLDQEAFQTQPFAWIGKRIYHLHVLNPFGGGVRRDDNPIEILDLSKNSFIAVPTMPFRILQNLAALNLEGNTNLRRYFGSAFSENKKLQELVLLDTGLSCQKLPKLPSGVRPQTDPEASSCPAAVALQNEGLEVGSCGDCKFYLDGNGELSRDSRCDARSCSGDQSFLCLAGKDIKSLKADVFADMTGIDKITLSGNSIGAIPPNLFATCHALRTLDLSNNNIIELKADAFKGLAELRLLALRKNKIETIQTDAFKGLAKLEKLTLAANRLSTVTAAMLKGAYGVKSLNLGSNHIRTVQETLWPLLVNIHELRLNDNQFKKILASTFSGLPNTLTFLDLNDNNRIKELVVPCFETLTGLKTLRLTNIGEGFKDFPDTLLKGLENLEDLELAENHITTITADDFKAVPKLKTLDLEHNDIKTFPVLALKYATQLQTINLKENFDHSGNAPVPITCCPKTPSGKTWQAQCDTGITTCPQ